GDVSTQRWPAAGIPVTAARRPGDPQAAGLGEVHVDQISRTYPGGSLPARLLSLTLERLNGRLVALARTVRRSTRRDGCSRTQPAGSHLPGLAWRTGGGRGGRRRRC